MERMPLGIEHTKDVLQTAPSDLSAEDSVIGGRIDGFSLKIVKTHEFQMLTVSIVVDLKNADIHGIRSLD